MNIYKKIANENYEEVSGCTTRTTSRHGVGKSLKRESRIRNRAAKRAEERMAFEDECNSAED